MEIMDSEASKLLDDFEQAAFLFGKIQDQHTDYLQRNQLTDVGKWNDERSHAIGNLQQALSAMWSCDSLRADTRLGRSLQRRLGVIVERERELVENVKLRQDHLRDEMGKMRKGKKAMGGYGATALTPSTGLCFRNSS